MFGEISIIATDVHSIIFQRGRSTTNQEKDQALDFEGILFSSRHGRVDNHVLRWFLNGAQLVEIDRLLQPLASLESAAP